MLAKNGSIEQMKECGFIKIKDQLRLKNLCEPSAKDEGLMPHHSTSAIIDKASIAYGKLKMRQIKKLSHSDKHLYLLK